MESISSRHLIKVEDYAGLIRGIINESKGLPKAIFVVANKESYRSVYSITKSLFDLNEARCKDYDLTILQDNIKISILIIDTNSDVPSILALQPTVLIVTTDFKDENNRILQYLAYRTRGEVYFSPVPHRLI